MNPLLTDLLRQGIQLVQSPNGDWIAVGTLIALVTAINEFRAFWFRALNRREYEKASQIRRGLLDLIGRYVFHTGDTKTYGVFTEDGNTASDQRDEWCAKHK